MTALQIQRGFTLIELMVTLVVLAILVSLGVPSFTAWVQNSRLDTTTQTMSSLLKQARSEAASRQRAVTIDWSNADDQISADMYQDQDGDGSAFEAGDPVIKENFTFSSTGITINSTTNDTRVSFSANGALNEGGNAVTIGVCDDRGAAEGWNIRVNTVGRVSITQTGVNCTP